MNAHTLLATLALALAGYAAHAMPQQTAGLKGEVLEIKQVDSYSYLRLKTADGEVWAAVMKTPVRKGAQVSISNPTMMKDFESKALKMKFDRIVFGAIADPDARAAAPALHGQAAINSGPAIRVAKAVGPNAKTVAEVIGGMAALKDKTVLVRAQVVKLSAGILGSNWLHLQDGSGTAADKTNDIVVTTKDMAAVGDIVSAQGVVRTDVKLGSGYSYQVLIENAKLSK